MMAGVVVTTVDPMAARLLAFANGLRRRHCTGAAVHAALRTGLVLAVPVLPLCWLWPDVRWPLVAGWSVMVGGSAALAAARASRLADAALLRATDVAHAAGPDELAVLGDELGTWLEAHRRGQQSAMTGWLARAIDDQLPRLPRQRLAPIGRRSLGGLAWLLPLLLLLLLAILFTELLAPPWSGALGGRPRDLPGNGGGGDTQGEASGGGSTATGDAPPPPEPEPADAQQPPPTPPPPGAADAPPPVNERPPLLDLPEQQRFLVPEFLGDGPTRRVRMHAAEVEVGAPATSAAPPPAGSAPPQPVPSPQQETFARAAEAAQRARHVPPAERPMVDRFFQALREAAK
jgi:hypothetical protein